MARMPLLSLAVWFCLVSSVLGADRLTFIGVALDVETRRADRALQDYLHRKAGVSFAPEELEYGQVFDRLTHWDPRQAPYLARTTPYVYVVAEMLGADFEILATYVSAATRKTTYQSYFVVRRAEFTRVPSLTEVVDYLAAHETPARFVFHSRLSTSSFFLPSLYFRAQKIFNMDQPTESLIAIDSAQIEENSSTQLVKRVAEGQADLAAVWDGTKAKFDQEHSSELYSTYGSKVYFVPLPTAIPNDLLVCSASLDARTKEALRDALAAMSPTEIQQGDFLSWWPIREATDARAALAGLRWMARERAAPVTVDVHLEGMNRETLPGAMVLEAVQQAVRFSGTEFVLFDQDYHEHIDFRWTLETIHDGAVLLVSSIPGSGIPDQSFPLSFRDVEDLTQRIVRVIRSDLHRVRAVWPYSGSPPIVIRDLALTLAPGSQVKVQRIQWLDPERNSFRGGNLFDARILDSGFYTYELDPHDFPVGAATDFDPLSNTAFRVILRNNPRERLMFRIMTGILLALFVLAAVAALRDMLRRKPSDLASATAETRTTL